jgi:hypothetical protein
MSDSSDDDDDYLFQPVFGNKSARRQAPSQTRPTKKSAEPPQIKFIASIHHHHQISLSLSVEEIQQKGKKLVII